MMRQAVLTTAMTLTLAGTAQAQNGDLEKAYLKEFTFLKAAKEELQTRLRKVKATSEDRISAAKREIDRLEARVLGLRQQGDMLDEQLRDAERNSEAADRADVVYESLTRARDPLDAAGFEVPALPTDRVPTVEETIEVLGATFEKSALLLRTFDDLKKEQGKFFLVDGTLVDGEILSLGKIASYGQSGETAGALAPAGGGKFRIWPDPAPDTARSLIAGNSPPYLRVFLYESTEKAITAKAEKTFMQEVEAGGVIAYVIVGIGLLAAIMIVIRLITLLLVGAQTKSLANKVVPLVEQGNFKQAEATANSASGACARVLKSTIQNLDAEREQLDDVVQEAMLNETPAIERFGAAIIVIAAVAPLMGLLGTVTGMISTFDVITEFGTGDPRMLSGGISEALITTKLGLVVAIPTLLLGTLLAGRGDSIIADIEHAALRVINAHSGVSSNPQAAAPPPQTRPAPGATLEPST